MSRKNASNILTNDVNILSVNILKYPIMSDKKRESLADYVRRVRREKGFSTPQVEERSGKRITRGYVTQIENSSQLNVSTDKLRALAIGLGVPEKELFDVARGASYEETEKYRESRFAQLAQKAERLPRSVQKELNIILDMVEREIEFRLGGGSMTGWRIPVTEPANRESGKDDKRNRA